MGVSDGAAAAESTVVYVIAGVEDYWLGGFSAKAFVVPAVSVVGGGSYVDESYVLVGMAGMDAEGFAFNLDLLISADNVGSGHYPIVAVFGGDIAAALSAGDSHFDAGIDVDGVSNAYVFGG